MLYKILFLFDIDGTLIKPSKLHIDAFSICFKEIYSIDANISIINHRGMSDKKIIQEVLNKKGLSNKEIEIKINDCMNCISAKFKELTNNATIFPLEHVVEFLEKLKYLDILMGIVTGNIKDVALTKLSKSRILSFFKVYAFGNEETRRENLVKIAIDRAKDIGFKGNIVFVVGDTPRDIISGISNNTYTIGVATGSYSKEELKKTGADIVIEDFSDIENLFTFLNSLRIIRSNH